MATAPDKLPSQEKLLLDYIHRLEKHKAGRGLVHVHLSQLRPFNRRDQHIRVASGHFEGMVSDMTGQLFTLKMQICSLSLRTRCAPSRNHIAEGSFLVQ